MKGYYHWFLSIFIFLLAGVATHILNKNNLEKIEIARQQRLVYTHNRAVTQFSNGVEKMAGLVAGMKSYINLSETLPSQEEFQHFVQSQLEDIQSKDSMVISVIDTSHIFRQAFTRHEIDPAKVVGRSVKDFRAEEKIQALEALMETDELIMYPPVNLVEGWLGIPINFRIYRNGSVEGYVAPIINFSSIMSEVYDEETSRNFIFKFTTENGYDLDRTRSYNGTKVYNSNVDEEFYKNFQVLENSFITTTRTYFGFKISIATAYKEPTTAGEKFESILFICFGIFSLGLFLIAWQVDLYLALNRKLKVANDEIENKNKKLNIALATAQGASDAHEQAKRIAEQATLSKAEFLATMSHEIRTPMNGVLGMAQLLTDTSLSRVQKDYVDTMLSSGNLLLTIIDDVLDYSKLEAGKVELELVPLNLEHLLHGILEVMGRSLTKNIELILDYPPTIPTMFIGDSSRLRQIIYNLVGNAIKFTEQGSVAVLARYEGQTLTLEVKDTGIGITEEQQKNLFNSFTQADNSTTRKYGGTGLGLAICKDLTELMGGEITVQSDYGIGTSFTVSLNLAAEIKPEAKKIFNKTNFLLVEKNQDIFRIYAEFLHYYGANVTQCSESETLIDRLLDADAAESGVDLILISSKLATDQELKTGIAVRNHPKLNSIPIVLLRQSSNKVDLESYYSAGFTAFFTKPVRHELLIAGLKASIENTDPKTLITKHSLLGPSQSHAPDIKINGHILLVEDVLTNQIVAKTMLDNMGLTVDIAEDGLQAITQWQKGGYDLIFMDCRMPNMDGYEATRRIRSQEQNGRTPIIALTANATEGDRKKCHAAGMDAIVTKPFKPSDLQAVLTKWLVTSKSVATSSAASLAKTKSVSVAVLDIDMFKKTQELMGDAFSGLVDSVFQDTDKILEKLANWTDPLDSEGLALLSHSLKSSSVYIGATKLTHLAHECENDACDGKVEKALSHVKEMQQAYADVLEELAKLGFSKPL